MFGKTEFYQLEDVEKKILRELFDNSRINITKISRKHDLSIDVIRNRIKKLENNQIIIKYQPIIDYNKLGYEFFKTFLYFKNLSKYDEDRLMEYTRKNNKIIHLVKQISPWDVELEIMCDSYLEYTKIISDLTKEFSNIIHKVATAIMAEDYIWPAKKMIFEE
jgi:Lrp/AsnC family leucine-responsive transcriptional regulator